MAKRDGSYRMSNSFKLLYSCMSTEQKKVWKNRLIEADLNASGKDRMVMNYDVSPSGKIPKKVKASADLEQV